MKTLVMLQGLPGAGKSTWARARVVTSGACRVNKDDIRTQLEAGGWVWSHENGRQVIDIRDRSILQAFEQGATTVISDDCNFGRKHKERLEQLARQAGARFEVVKIDTPLEECLRRNALRTGKACIPEAAIRAMAAAYTTPPAPAFARYTRPDSEHSPTAIICDLDGTLSLFADKGHRGPYDATLCDQDDLNVPIRRLLEVYYRFMHYQIIYLSGREERFRVPTNAFLRAHHCPPGPLHMRPTGDRRTDWIVKGELFDAHVRHQYCVELVLDDRDQVVKFWRSIGLTCLQVAEGNF